MESSSSSIVSRARTAFHSAASKAERVFTDIKKSEATADPDYEKESQNSSLPEFFEVDEESTNCPDAKHLRCRPFPIKTTQDWHERLKNIRIGKKGVENIERAANSAMAFANSDESLHIESERGALQSQGSKLGFLEDSSKATNRSIIPSTVIIKQLAIAFEAGKKHNKSMKDLVASSRNSSPLRERGGLSFSAVRSLVLREKEEKFAFEFGADEKVLSLINSLVEPGRREAQILGRKTCSDLEAAANITSLPKEIHGAPPESFVVKLAEATGSLKTLKKMALFWCRILDELRRLWSEQQYVPGIPRDETPDLNSCLIYQQLQVINSCISRKKRRLASVESLDLAVTLASLNVGDSATTDELLPANSVLCARNSTGELLPRAGVDKISESLLMLETGEPVYAPILQEGPLLTEDLIKETEELVLRTGSVGAGCSQLLSDMQAFKAANPGCILEDFVRWHSPPDWTEADASDETKESLNGGDLSSARGQLSRRMQKEGNLWRELWETAKPVPSIHQAPLFDEDLAVEGILNILEDIQPPELFQQLFIALLGSAFVIAEYTLSAHSNLSRLFYECKDYIIATCQGDSWVEKIDDICQVYETLEAMLQKQDEVLILSNQPEESVAAGDVKSRFKRLGFNFGRKNIVKPTPKVQKNSEIPTRHSFSSIFSRRPPKRGSASPSDDSICSIENYQTV